MLQAALAAGIASEGRDVIDVGMIPTPGLAWLAGEQRRPAAMISASHNPYEDNGIKLFSPGGTKLPLQVELAIHDELDRLFGTSAGEEMGGEAGSSGEIGADPEQLTAYAARLLAIVDSPGQSGAGKSSPAGSLGGEVVIDCANGAASVLVPLIFEQLGIEHHVIFARPNGVNINHACGSTHPEALAKAVVERSAVLGIALDGDADRMMAIDHRGELVDGDQLIAMFALDLHARAMLRGGRVVITVMSNLGLRHALSSEGIGVVETPVGDRHVADAMEENGLVLGGEQSGHLIFAEHATTGDGVLTALFLIDLLRRKGCSLAELAASSMTRQPQVLQNVAVTDPSQLAGAHVVWSEVRDVEAELGQEGRVLLRASGTESCVRVMVEAPTPELATSAASRLVAAVRRHLA